MRIEHIAMYVRDLEKARDFFVSFLEGKPNEGYHNACAYSLCYISPIYTLSRVETRGNKSRSHDREEEARIMYDAHLASI